LGLYRAFPAVVSLRRVRLWQCAVVGLLVVCNGGALYYIVSKAAVRGYDWQVSFLKISLFEWFSEVVLLRGVEIALFDYGLCWLVGDEVEAAVRRLEAVAAEGTVGSPTVADDGRVAVDDGAVSVSQEMARQWSGLPESRWVAGLRAGRSVSYGTVAAVGSRLGGSDSSDGRSDHRRRWWTRLLSRGSLETWVMAVSFGSPLVLAWLVFMYYRFVDGWLASLSALGQGLAAMTVILSVGLIGAMVGYERWRRPRVDPAAAMSVPHHDVVAVDGILPEQIRDDDQVAIELDGGSWVWSSSSSSLSLSMSPSWAKGSSSASWQLSDSQSNERHSESIDGEDVGHSHAAIADDPGKGHCGSVGSRDSDEENGSEENGSEEGRWDVGDEDAAEDDAWFDDTSTLSG
jgi:hypothetical protein